MIYLSFIGNHDQIIPGQSYGAALTIFLQYREQIDRVYLLVTPSKKDQKVNYAEIAASIKSVMDQEKPGITVDLVPFDLSNPVDYDLVYPKMLDETQKIFEDETIREAEKIINITSGTPTMTACWILLHKSGLIPNSKLVQSFETRYARERGTSVQEVNLEIDDFPQITAPAVLKRQLTILSREKNDLAEKVKLAELNEKIPELIGKSKAIQDIKEQIIYDINASTHVLIVGERGTGKQIVADSIWKLYHHEKDTQLRTFDCGTFSPQLITAELFGHTKGAFTGAVEAKDGILKKCHNRMLFLDETGNLPIAGQNALLRYLSEGEFKKVGSNEIIKVNTQVIAATNKNINDSTLFAQDLKDRFDEIVELPPLRKRRSDIPILVQHFISRYSEKPLILDTEIIKKLSEYDWPGNVRELENWIKRIMRRFNKGGTIQISDLPGKFIEMFLAEEETDECLPELPLYLTLEEYIEKIREKARTMAEGNMAEVDRLLRQSPGTEKQRQWRLKKMEK